jgi:hypothetical protein
LESELFSGGLANSRLEVKHSGRQLILVKAGFSEELTVWEVKMLFNLLTKTNISIEALKLLFKLSQSPNLVKRRRQSDLLVKKAKKKILLGH